MIGYLNPGDQLTLRHLKIVNSITTAWLCVYTTDRRNRNIMIVTPFTPSKWFDSKRWARRGFRLEHTTSPIDPKRANKASLPTGMNSTTSTPTALP